MKPSFNLRLICAAFLALCILVCTTGCKKKDNDVVTTSVSKMAGTRLFHGKYTTVDPGIHGGGPSTTVTNSMSDRSFVITTVNNKTVKINDINFTYDYTDNANHYLFFKGDKFTPATMKYQYENNSIYFTYWDPNYAWGATMEYWNP